MIDPITEHIIYSQIENEAFKVVTEYQPQFYRNVSIDNVLKSLEQLKRIPAKSSFSKTLHKLRYSHSSVVTPDKLKGIATIAAAAAASAVLIVAAYKLYEIFFSRAARACKYSEDKDRCLLIYRIKAYEEQLDGLRTAQQKYCVRTDNPQECKYRLQERIEHIEGKIRKAKKKLEKMT